MPFIQIEDFLKAIFENDFIRSVVRYAALTHPTIGTFFTENHLTKSTAVLLILEIKLSPQANG